MRLFFVGFIFMMTISAQAREFSLQIDANSISSLSPEERTAINSSLEAVEGLLPTKIKDALAPKVTLQLPLLRFRKSRTNANRWIQGILLREIFRLYDNTNLRYGKAKQLQSFCGALASTPMNPALHDCVSLLKQKHTLSDHPVFLTAAGWTKQGLILKTRDHNNNNNSENWSNPELGNLREPQTFMAVNFELFLLDPEYQCRKPSLSRLFQKFLNHTPFSGEQCRQSHQVQLEPDILVDRNPQTIDLDFSRLYQIDYLLASKGENIGSRWGHSMYRLVFCKPGRPLGPNCRWDTAYHIVASFAALVDSTEASPLKGLTGAYESRLFFSRFRKVIQDYTKNELRELISLPLNLSSQQKIQFVYRLLEQYWSYKGSYRFLTNNCAHEALSVLQVAMDSRVLAEKTVLSPIGLFDLLAETKLIDKQVLTDKVQAEEQSYFVPSFKLRFDDAIKNLKIGVKVSILSEQRIESLLTDTAFNQRRLVFNTIESSLQERTGKVSRYHRSLLASLYLIEDYAFTLSQLELSQKMRNKLEEALKAEGLDQTLTKLLLQKPTEGLERGYGIPLASEMESNNDLSQNVIPAELLHKIRLLVEEIQNSHSLEIERLQTIERQKLKILTLLNS